MAKIIKINKDNIDYGRIELDSISAVESFEITQDADNAITLTEILFPIHVMGKLSTESEYSTSIVGSYIISNGFIDNEQYFMDTDGTITTDETETGIGLGVGQVDKNLLVNPVVYLQDALNSVLEDAEGNLLEDV